MSLSAVKFRVEQGVCHNIANDVEYQKPSIVDLGPLALYDMDLFAQTLNIFIIMILLSWVLSGSWPDIGVSGGLVGS